VHDEVGEEQAPLAGGEPVLDALALPGDGETAADLDARGAHGLQRTCNARERRCVRVRSMSTKVINCECGQVVRADSDDELVAKVESHVVRDHPELVGKLTRADVLAMAEDAP
jgi:hypothetical protein